MASLSNEIFKKKKPPTCSSVFFTFDFGQVSGLTTCNLNDWNGKGPNSTAMEGIRL